MNNQIIILAGFLGLFGIGCALALRMGVSRWQCKSAALIEKLKTAARTKGMVSFRDFDCLPAPVAAYFRFALREGQAMIRTTTIGHEGKFCLNEKWIPFVSQQHFAACPPSFVWDATMKMNRWITVCVRDSYLSRSGVMSAKILALFPVVNAHDDAHLNTSELMRYLAELAWLPTALLPTKNLRWTPINDQKAMATLRDGDTTVSLEFSFAPGGEITGIFAPARPYENKGDYKFFPWTGRYWNYQSRNGVMIPLEAEVAWQMPEGHRSYFKCEITSIQYEYSNSAAN